MRSNYDISVGVPLHWGEWVAYFENCRNAEDVILIKDDKGEMVGSTWLVWWMLRKPLNLAYALDIYRQAHDWCMAIPPFLDDGRQPALLGPDAKEGQLFAGSRGKGL
jgi:hypothetical protein